MNVRTKACNTNMEKVRVSRTPAWRPMFNTMSSTRLHDNRPWVSSYLHAYIRIGNVPLATHEGTDGAGLAEVETTELGGDGAREELGEERDNTQQDCVAPSDTVVQETQVRPETGKGEVLERQVSYVVRRQDKD